MLNIFHTASTRFIGYFDGFQRYHWFLASPFLNIDNSIFVNLEAFCEIRNDFGTNGLILVTVPANYIQHYFFQHLNKFPNSAQVRKAGNPNLDVNVQR